MNSYDNKEQRTKNKEIIPLPFTMAICTACMTVMTEVFLVSTASVRPLQEAWVELLIFW